MQSSLKINDMFNLLPAATDEAADLSAMLRDIVMLSGLDAVLKSVAFAARGEPDAKHLLELRAKLGDAVKDARTVGECRRLLTAALPQIMQRAAAKVAIDSVRRHIALLASSSASSSASTPSVAPRVAKPLAEPRVAKPSAVPREAFGASAVPASMRVIEMIEAQNLLVEKHGLKNGKVLGTERKMIQHLVIGDVSVQDAAFAQAETIAGVRNSITAALNRKRGMILGHGPVDAPKMRSLIASSLMSLQADLEIHRGTKATDDELAVAVETICTAVYAGDEDSVVDVICVEGTKQFNRLNTADDDVESRFEDFEQAFVRAYGVELSIEQIVAARLRFRECTADDVKAELLKQFMPRKSAAMEQFQKTYMPIFRQALRDADVDPSEARNFSDALLKSFLSRSYTDDDEMNAHMAAATRVLVRRAALGQESPPEVVRGIALFDQIIYRMNRDVDQEEIGNDVFAISAKQDAYVRSEMMFASDHRLAALRIAVDHEYATNAGFIFASEGQRKVVNMDKDYFDCARETCMILFQIESRDEKKGRPFHATKKLITKNAGKRPRTTSRSTTRQEICATMLAILDDAKAKHARGELVVKMQRKRKATAVSAVPYPDSEDNYTKGKTDVDTESDDDDVPPVITDHVKRARTDIKSSLPF